MPWEGGRRVVIPDRWGRAVRWLGFHAAVVVILGTLLGTQQYYLLWIDDCIWPTSFRHPALFTYRPGSPDRILIWFSQSVLAWAVLVCGLIVPGLLVSWCFPRRHRAAKLGGIKWGLYMLPIVLAPLGAWYGYYAVNPEMHWSGFGIALPPPSVDADLLAGVYGLWWAAGLAKNPYDRARGVRGFLMYGGLYAACWLLLTRVLFPVGPLETLL